jgi:hypothetical protein
MKAKPNVVIVGTAKALAGNGEGFSANGESQFSRRAAHPENVRMKGYVEPPRKRPPNAHAAHATDIKFNLIEIERMQRAMTVEKNPVRLAKLAKNVAIKRAFVEKLKSENDEQKT